MLLLLEKEIKLRCYNYLNGLNNVFDNNFSCISITIILTAKRTFLTKKIPDQSQRRGRSRRSHFTLSDGGPVQGPATSVVRRSDAKHETLLL